LRTLAHKKQEFSIIFDWCGWVRKKAFQWANVYICVP